MLNKNKWGFTLVELLITVAVLGILSAAAYVGVGEVRKTIRDNKRRADLNEVARALELFKADYGQYPINNYWSTRPVSGEYSFMPFLKDGGSMTFVYPGGPQSRDITGNYLKELVSDPINQVDNFWHGYMYFYYGSQWGNWVQQLSDLIDYGYSEIFPLECPNSEDECGLDCSVYDSDDPNFLDCLSDSWVACCNTGGCYDQYCEHNVVTGATTFSTYSLSPWSQICYGEGSSRSMALLGTRLEKPSKADERISNVFSFCPTADPSHPEHATFIRFKKLFPRGKDCYNGDDAVPPSYQGDYNCSDPGDEPYGGSNWAYWALADYNYFVPLTGEFNLR